MARRRQLLVLLSTLTIAGGMALLAQVSSAQSVLAAPAAHHKPSPTPVPTATPPPTPRPTPTPLPTPQPTPPPTPQPTAPPIAPPPPETTSNPAAAPATIVETEPPDGPAAAQPVGSEETLPFTGSLNPDSLPQTSVMIPAGEAATAGYAGRGSGAR